VTAADGTEFVAAYGGESEEQIFANRNRTIACVNAMAGVPTEMLLSVGNLGRLLLRAPAIVSGESPLTGFIETYLNSLKDSPEKVDAESIAVSYRHMMASDRAMAGVPDPEKLMAAVRKAAGLYDRAKAACHGQFVFPHIDDIAAALKGKDPCSDD